MRDNPWIIRTYLKAQLVESNSRRVDEIELSERTIVGVNKFVETEASPLPTGEGSIITIPPEVEQNQIANLQACAPRATRPRSTGLDGHSNGAEQVAVRARDAGMDVVYEGIRFTPAEIVKAARDKNVHVVGLSSRPARTCRS